MRLSPLAFAFLLAASSFAAAAPQSSATAPPATADDKKPVVVGVTPSDKPDYSKEAFVVERLYAHYRFENDGTGSKEVILRVHVQSEVGLQRFGQLRFGYNSANDKLEIGYIRVIKPDGSVVTAGAEAVQDLSASVQQIAPVYTDYREKHVTVPGLRPGDTLECQITTKFQTPLAAGQFWTQYDFNQGSVVLDEQMEIDIPASRTVKLKTKPGYDPKTTEEGGRRVYRWTSSHLAPTEVAEEKSKKKKKKKSDEVPDVQLTTFNSWEEVGHWYAALEKDRRTPSPEVRAKAESLTKGLTTDVDKTQALYDFVAQNFRYVSLSLGLTRYQPQAAGDILRNQYGDCKDKNTLLAALLEAEGLHSSTVLISSARKLDPDVPSPSQFNHAITMLPLGKDEIWMDTTTEVAPFRLLTYQLRKKQALVIPPGGTAHLEETPADPPTPDSELTEVTGKVDDTGKLDATITYTLRGDTELLQRIVFRRTAAAQWQKYVEGMNKAVGGDVSNIKISDPTATREPFTMSYQLSKANFLDWSKKKLQLKLPLSYIGLAAVSEDVGEEDDKDKDEDASDSDSTNSEPFKLGPPHQQTYRLKLDLASRYQAAVPVPVAIERDYGLYQSTYKSDAGTFTAERKLNIRLGELPPARADDYRAFRHGVLADAAQTLRIENASADASSAPANLKTSDLIRSGNDARKNGNYGLAIDLLNRAVEAEPKSKRAWDILGLAYLDDDQEGLAINAFQKQIEVNPFDESAFNNLGRVYLRQRKYDEADKWFRKQIEVNPLDKYAHGNLGISLIEQHKYEDAVSELERAVQVEPGNSVVQVNLGRAYLNLHQDDKAMSAFDKALTISPTPSAWNNIAYELALKKAHLDRARSYAESAVSATAAALRNVSLDQINRRDPERSAMLAGYWDTLGWVAFAEGKVDIAERYVSSAWQLGGSANEADHLGQIYENRGNKPEAIHFYALAMNARHPGPEIRGRLAALAGGDDKVGAPVEKYRNEQEQQRTFTLSNAAKLEGTADFFLLLSPGQTATETVEAVSFISGEEKLKALTEALRATKFTQKFPDDTPVRIVRRGTLKCKPVVDCTFLLALPGEVKSLD